MDLAWPLPLLTPPRVTWMGDSAHPAGRYRYQLPRLWAIHWYDYPAQLQLNRVQCRLKRGGMTLQQPGVTSEYDLRRSGRHLAAHFQLPMVSDQPALIVPGVIDAVRVPATYHRMLQAAVTHWPVQPIHATAILLTRQ